VRWLKVLRAAQQPAGGSWDLDFCPQGEEEAPGRSTHARTHACTQQHSVLLQNLSAHVAAGQRVQTRQLLTAPTLPNLSATNSNTDMTPRRLKQLADVIDAAFLDGSFAVVRCYQGSSGLLLPARAELGSLSLG
jgi:hypothetical protein